MKTAKKECDAIPDLAKSLGGSVRGKKLTGVWGTETLWPV
jgi:hypothetical protein